MKPQNNSIAKKGEEKDPIIEKLVKVNGIGESRAQALKEMKIVSFLDLLKYLRNTSAENISRDFSNHLVDSQVGYQERAKMLASTQTLYEEEVLISDGLPQGEELSEEKYLVDEEFIHFNLGWAKLKSGKMVWCTRFYDNLTNGTELVCYTRDPIDWMSVLLYRAKIPASGEDLLKPQPVEMKQNHKKPRSSSQPEHVSPKAEEKAQPDQAVEPPGEETQPAKAVEPPGEETQPAKAAEPPGEETQPAKAAELIDSSPQPVPAPGEEHHLPEPSVLEGTVRDDQEEIWDLRINSCKVPSSPESYLTLTALIEFELNPKSFGKWIKEGLQDRGLACQARISIKRLDQDSKPVSSIWWAKIYPGKMIYDCQVDFPFPDPGLYELLPSVCLLTEEMVTANYEPIRLRVTSA